MEASCLERSINMNGLELMSLSTIQKLDIKPIEASTYQEMKRYRSRRAEKPAKMEM